MGRFNNFFRILDFGSDLVKGSYTFLHDKKEDLKSGLNVDKSYAKMTGNKKWIEENFKARQALPDFGPVRLIQASSMRKKLNDSQPNNGNNQYNYSDTRAVLKTDQMRKDYQQEKERNAAKRKEKWDYAKGLIDRDNLWMNPYLRYNQND